VTVQPRRARGIRGISAVSETSSAVGAAPGWDTERGGLSAVGAAAMSLAAGAPVRFEGWTSSFVDGAGGKSVLPSMWPLLSSVVSDSIVVSLAEAADAMRFTAERRRIIIEGAAACAVAAALSPRMAAAGHRKIVAVVSGGNIDLSRFASLTGACS